MAEVIFTGDFNLDQALSKFNTFATQIESRLAKMTKSFGEAGNTAITGGLTPEQTAKQSAEAKRQQKITDQHLAHNIAKAKEETKAREAEQKKQLRDQQNYEKQLNTLRNTEGRRRARELQKEEQQALDSQKRIGDGFIQLAIRSYAFHQIGALLNRAVTQPLKNLANQILETTLRFDTFEELLTKRGGRSIEDLGRSIDTVGKVAKLRNLDLETSVSLYSKLFESTRGAIDDQLFEKVGKGLSNVLTTIEAGEKRAFFGQIQDVLGGGNVANLERTLSLAPALKAVYDDIKEAAGGAVTDQQALIEAFTQLGELPALNDLATKLKNLRVNIELLQHRLGEVFKNDLANIVDFIEKRVFPVVDSLVTRFEQLPSAIQNTIAVLTAATALLAPIISTIGTLILLFPNLTAENAFITRLVAALPRLVSLLNPITAAVAAIAVAAGLLAKYNIGGAGDAIDSLATTIKDKLLTALSDLYNILTSLYGIVSRIFELLYQIPLVQTLIYALGGLVNILASLLNVLLLVQDPLHALSVSLQLINDLLHGDFELGFDRFRLAQLKMTKQIYDSMPVLYKFADWLIGLFGEGGSSQAKLTNEIASLEKEVSRLSTTIDQEALDAFEKYVNKVNGLDSAYQRATASAISLKDAIDAQKQAIASQSLQASSAYQNQYAEAENRLSAFYRNRQQTRLGQIDYTSEEGRQAAERGLADIDKSNQAEAERKRQQRITKAAQDKLIADREVYVKELTKKTKEGEKELDAAVAEIYGDYINRIVGIVSGGGEITAERLEKELYEPTRKQIGQAPIDSKLVKEITQRIELDKQSLGITLKRELDNRSELEQALLDKATLADETRKKIEEGRETERRVKADQVYKEEADKLDKETGQIELLIREAIEQARVASDATEVIQKLNDAQTDLLAVETRRYELERKHAVEIYGTGEKATLDEKLGEVDSEHRKRITEIQEQRKQAEIGISRKFVRTEKENQKVLKELQQSLLKSYDTRIETLIELIALTGDETKYAGELERVINERNKALQKAATEPLNEATDNLISSLRFGAGDLNNTQEARDALAVYQGMVRDFKAALSSDTLTEADIDKLITQSQGIIEVLRVTLGGIGEFESTDRKLKIQSMLDNFVIFVKGLKDAKKAISELEPAEIGILRSRERSLEMQGRVNEAVKEQIRLTQQLLELQQKNYTPNITNLKSFGKALVNIFTGGQEAQYEMQKQILALEKESARIETELAILRLEIEKEIYILKLKEQGATQEEIDAARESYENMIAILKEKGKLQQDLLDEQMRQLNEFAGGLSGLITGIFSKLAKKLLGGKKKDTSKVTVLDDEGNDIPIDDEELDPMHGIDEPAVSDDSVDKTGENVDETLGWLDKLTGGLKTTKNAIFAFGDAIAEMSDKSIIAILRALKAELKALGAKFAVKALEFAALALAAAVFGDYHTAAKAAATAAAYGVAAAAAYGAAGLIGTIDGNGASTSTSSASRAAGTNNADTPSRDKQVLKQKAAEVYIQLDIRTDDGIIIKKNIKALNQNTELTNLTLNQQEGWAFAPTP